MPSMPRLRRCVSGNTPLPSRVEVTGQFERFRQLHQFLVGAGDHRAVTGEDHGALGLHDELRRLLHRRLVDLEVVLGMIARQIHLRVQVAGEGPWLMSFGMSISTGPGRPVVAM